MSDSLTQKMWLMGTQARLAARKLATVSPEQKRAALLVMAGEVRANVGTILKANAKDMENGAAKELSKAMMDRLKLDQDRVESIAAGIDAIAELPEPVGRVVEEINRPNGLLIQKVSTPLGVIGVIYESRPNVTADAGALCLKAGNAVILRGGSDSIHSSMAIHDCLRRGLLAENLPQDSIQLVESIDRAAVGEMLGGLNGNIDVIVPRGGKSLVGRVQAEARVPVFAHLEGICHVYVDRDASLGMAIEVVLNAKMRRTGICGAAETLLVDVAVEKTHLAPILEALAAAGCEIRGDESVCHLFGGTVSATEEDWSTEYLDGIISVRMVDGVEQAIEHIASYSSGHTESIITDSEETAAQFFKHVDSAIVLHNASTQFADGGEFGMGAEIGIATGKMHARGPVGAQQLTSFKYCVHGSGQVRPN